MLKFIVQPLALWMPLLVAAAWIGGCNGVDVPKADRLSGYSVEPYAEVLDAVVEGEEGLVDYHAFAQNPQLEKKLDIYLNAVGRFGPDTSPATFPTPEDKLAYYINAYNAYMLKIWLSHGAAEADADRGVNKLWFVTNGIRVDGGGTNLDHLEQRVIRPRYAERYPQLHFGLICGAMSCPPLLDEPYRGGSLKSQLDAVGERWLAQPDGLRWDAKNNRVIMSAIFDWYGEDFDGVGGLEGVVQKYAPDSAAWKADAIEAASAGRVEFLDYDWDINLAK